jgi:8-hydroxy-5-deazaflavin:NADPH oxidoreductase
MKITILGPGNMGVALATNWKLKNHEITFSHSKNKERIKTILESIKGSQYLELKEAVQYSEVIIITSVYEGLAEIFNYKELFKNKIVISCTSNLLPDFQGNTMGLVTERTISVAEEIQENLPSAFVGEAFNTAFAVNIVNLERLNNKETGSIFYCSNHATTKRVASQLISDLSFQPIDAGDLKSARALETFATVWVQLAVVSNKYPGFGIKIINQ